MESAIASALRCPRTRARRVDDDYQPPYPAWAARAEAGVERVTMAYLGVQWRGAADEPTALATFDRIIASLARADGPVHHDLARYIDPQGYDTLIAIAYWTDPATFKRWSADTEVDGWWASPERLIGSVGVFREVLSPSPDAFETLFSASDRMEAAGVAMGERSADEVQEHAYWGSMRDRFALAQTDAMAPSGEIATVSGRPGPGHRVTLTGNHNLAVIRSGQDWTDTTGRERSLYLDEMEPVLRAGMDFLRDEGVGVGCYCNRYMRRLGVDGHPIEKSFGYSFWRSLAAMERWAERHPSHVAIFGKFMTIVNELHFDLKLRLYHEVSVLAVDRQDFEYVNCHPRTGILNGRGV